MQKTKVAVIFGGASTEYEVSLRSVTAVLENLDKEKYEAYLLGITKDGRWMLYSGDAADIQGDGWHTHDCERAFISPDRSHGGIVAIDKNNAAREIPVDVAFPVLHGKNGEDGTIQGLFSLAGIPFVGAGTLASAACMDKAVAIILFENAGVPHCKWDFATSAELADFDSVAERFENKLGYPMFVKPANSGSSVGVSRVENRFALKAAVKLALLHDSKVVVEEAVEGQELECAVFGNSAPTASAVGEILPPEKAFYTYEEKYTTDTTGLRIPAALSEEDSNELRSLAVRAYCALGCEGLSRVDFFRRASDGRIMINEINTMPGFTSISMYPKLMAHSGTDFRSLITGLIELALDRGAK